MPAIYLTREETINLITALCDGVRDATVAKAGDMPDEWDGYEIRQYLAEAFAFEANLTVSRPGYTAGPVLEGARLAAYRKAKARL